MLQFINRYKISNSFRNISYLFGVTIIIQILGIAFMPILTRIYTPTNFGVLTSFTTLIAVLSQFSTGKYGQVIALTESKIEANKIFKASQHISIGLFSFLLVSIFISNIFDKIFDFKYWHYFIPFVIIFIGLNEGCQFFLAREKMFKEMAFSRLIQGFSNVLFSFIFGIISFFQPIGLLIGVLFSQLSTYIASSFYLKRQLEFAQIGNTLDDSLDIFKKYKKYSIFGISGAILDSLGQNLLMFFLMLFHSTETIGLFGLATRVVQIPGSLISNSINSVLLQKFSDDNFMGKSLKPIVLKIAFTLFCVVILPLILFLMFAEPIFQFAFGLEWTEAAKFSKILAILYSVRIIVSPTTLVFTVKNKLNISFYWQLLYFISGVIFLYIISTSNQELYSLLIIFVFFDVLLYLIYFFLSFKEA